MNAGVQHVTKDARRRVLVIEDEPIREFLRLHLSLAGFEVEEIGDGRVALNVCATARSISCSST